MRNDEAAVRDLPLRLSRRRSKAAAIPGLRAPLGEGKAGHEGMGRRLHRFGLSRGVSFEPGWLYAVATCSSSRTSWMVRGRNGRQKDETVGQTELSARKASEGSGKEKEKGRKDAAQGREGQF